MLDLRRAFVCVLLACASCDSGPTSDWPGAPDEDRGDDESNKPPFMTADSGTSTGVMDASIRGDASAPSKDSCVGDASADAGDAGCEPRDE